MFVAVLQKQLDRPTDAELQPSTTTTLVLLQLALGARERDMLAPQ